VICRIKWCGNYISKKGLRSPFAYTADPGKAKTWKTRKNAERYLSLKDPTYASQCEIEEAHNGA
jgi:hypothetical protein